MDKMIFQRKAQKKEKKKWKETKDKPKKKFDFLQWLVNTDQLLNEMDKLQICCALGWPWTTCMQASY